MYRRFIKYLLPAAILTLIVWDGFAASIRYSSAKPIFVTSKQDTTSKFKLNMLDSLKANSVFTSDSVRQDTVRQNKIRPIPNTDTQSRASLDSLNARRDSIKAIKSSLEAPIHGNNKDSLVYDVVNKTMYVYGEADVKYDKIGIKSEYISLNSKLKNVSARGRSIPKPGSPGSAGAGGEGEPKDSVEYIYVKPVFTEGEMTYEVDSVDYNMDTQKAYIVGVSTKEGEGILYGGEIKKMKDNVIHMHNGRYTTCDASCPHFYLHITKGTVIPATEEKSGKTVFGPSYLVIEDVPLPFLGLPFGFFPQLSNRSSGFIFPQIGEDATKGFFLRDMGYYLVVSDNWDVKLTGSIYTLGTWEANIGTGYTKRYKYNGSFNFYVASTVTGEIGATDYVNQKDYKINWNHQQDSKASPGTSFSASVRFETSTYNRYGTVPVNEIGNAQSNSSISYQRSFAGSLLNLSVTGSMSQNMRDSSYLFNLPNVTFSAAKINPFKRKVLVGPERWYEKIGFTYNFGFTNSTGNISEKDLFSQKMFDQMDYSATHSIPINATYNLFNFLNISPSVQYNEKWYFKKVMQSWDDINNTVARDTVRSFSRVYDYNASLQIGTIFYGMYEFGKKEKPSLQIRHVMTPSISLRYTPAFGQFYETYTNGSTNEQVTYTPYPTAPSKKSSSSLTFGLTNTLEMKVRDDSDSTGYRKLKIFDAFNINTGYNFSAESFKLNPFTLYISSPIVKDIKLNINATLDPYQLDAEGNKIDAYLFKKGFPLRLVSASTSFSYNFGSKEGVQGSGPSMAANNMPAPVLTNPNLEGEENDFFQKRDQMSQLEKARLAASQYYDFNIPWNFNFNYTINYSNDRNVSQITQTLGFGGSIKLTPKWMINATSGFDFKAMEITNTVVTIVRDLHCWQMTFQWIPIGYYKSWNFTIRANSSMLADLLKWDKQKSRYENYY